MEEEPLQAVELMVQRLLLTPEDQDPCCDPELVLGKFPELLDGISGGDNVGAMRNSLHTQLELVSGFSHGRRNGNNRNVNGRSNGSQPAPSTHWVEAVLERACEQVVECHFEVSSRRLVCVRRSSVNVTCG